MNSRTTSSCTKRKRSAAVLFGPPGLFIGLTLAAIIAGAWISRSTTASAVPTTPSPAATAR